jgi:hypothetical protein
MRRDHAEEYRTTLNASSERQLPPCGNDIAHACYTVELSSLIEA